jgi:hypothetical protein
MKRLTALEKYNSIKRQAENAGMEVTEKNRRIVVSRKKNDKGKVTRKSR